MECGEILLTTPALAPPTTAPSNQSQSGSSISATAKSTTHYPWQLTTKTTATNHQTHRYCITSILCQTTRLVGAEVGICKANISARSLRAGGAMALMCANLDSNRIKDLDRCQSNKMMRCLYIQVPPIMRNFSSLVFAHGKCELVQNPQAAH
jgi:hypothetical protein